MLYTLDAKPVPDFLVGGGEAILFGVAGIDGLRRWAKLGLGVGLFTEQQYFGGLAPSSYMRSRSPSRATRMMSSKRRWNVSPVMQVAVSKEVRVLEDKRTGLSN